MKSFFSLLILILMFGCSNPSNNLENKIAEKDTSIILKDSTLSKTKAREIDTCLVGDINADNIKDTAFITLPIFGWDSLDKGCVDNNCEIKIKFSNNLPSFTCEPAISAGIYNIKDIDKDGICEIMVCPGWFQSCWGSMRFYSLKNNVWTEFGVVSSYMCDDEAITNRVKIINKHTIEVSEDVINDDGDRIQKAKRITLEK